MSSYINEQNRKLSFNNADNRRIAKARRNPTEKPKPATTITVRLDSRTVITVASEKALAFWRTRYPNLTIISKP